MTTIRQVGNLLKPIQKTFLNTEIAGRFLVVKPVHHVIRGLFIDRCRSAHLFKVYCIIDQTLSEFGHLAIRNAPELYHEDRYWTLNEPYIESAVLEVFERKALPLIKDITTLQDFSRFIKNAGTNPDFIGTPGISSISLDIALGNLAAAQTNVDTLISIFSSRFDQLQPYKHLWIERMKFLQALISSGDRAAMADHLHTIERCNVEKWKIAHLYEPTPFPLELM